MNINKLIQLIGEEKTRKVDVIRMTGISRPTLDSILAGNDFKVSNLEKIARALKVPVGYFFDESNTITTTGDYSPASDSGDITLNIGDPVLAERIRSMEALIREKDERISDLRDLLKMKKSDQ